MWKKKFTVHSSQNKNRTRMTRIRRIYTDVKISEKAKVKSKNMDARLRGHDIYKNVRHRFSLIQTDFAIRIG